VLVLVALAAVFAVGIALGVALDNGSGPQGTQTIERTLRIVTVTAPGS
jgi:hypothetical protein